MAKKKKGSTRGRGGNSYNYNNLDDENDGDDVLNSPNRSGRKKKKKNKSAVVSHDDTSFRKSLRGAWTVSFPYMFALLYAIHHRHLSCFCFHVLHIFCNYVCDMSAEDGTKSIREMASDGNCLFRSISDQLLGDYGEQHSDIRRKLCDFLETKEDEFIHFLFLGEEEDADAETFEDYVTMMREDGEWGGNLELVIASQYYRRNIVVYSAVGAFSIECGQETNSGNDLLVSYHENDHYNSVYDAKRPIHKRPPLQKITSEQGPSSDHSNTASTTSTSSSSNNNTRKKEAKVKNDSTGVNKGNATSTSSNNPKSQLPMRRNDLCSCGSGLRYKKCCMETDKSLLKVQKWKEKNGLITADLKNQSNEQKDDNDDDDKEVAEGGIKLLKI
eukprot:scaffold440970_cov51-Attheya_sp.AAC.1